MAPVSKGALLNIHYYYYYIISLVTQSRMSRVYYGLRGLRLTKWSVVILSTYN